MRKLKLYIDYYLLIILFLPLLLIVINNNWIFTSFSPGYIDPWLYFGYFQHLPDYLKEYNVYYGTRLSWIIPGYIAYRLFPPIIANYVLHLAVYYLSTYSMYFIVKILFNKRAALVIAVLMGLYSWFLVSTGWDYIDGIGIAYYLLTLLLITLGIKTRIYTWFFLAGGSLILLITTNLFLIILIPSIIFFYIYIGHLFNKTDKYQIVYFLAGIFFIFAFLGLISKFYNGYFIFFSHSLQFAAQLIKQPNPWHEKNFSWLWGAHWLIWLCCTFIVSPIFFTLKTKNSSKRNYKIAIFFQTQFIINFIIFFLLEIVIKFPVLQYFYYASYLIPCMFLAISAWIAPGFNRVSNKIFIFLLILFLIFMLIPHFFNFLKIDNKFNLTLLSGLLCLIAFLLLIRTRKIFFWLVAFLLLSISNTLALNYPSAYHLNKARNNSAVSESFLSTIDSLNFIEKSVSLNQVIFWYSNKEENFSTYRAINSIYLWVQINETLPDLTLMKKTPKEGDKLIILYGDDVNYIQAYRNLVQKNLPGKLIASKNINRGKIHYKINIIEIISN